MKNVRSYGKNCNLEVIYTAEKIGNKSIVENLS